METNIEINQTNNVSINIDALKAIIQGALQSTKQRVLVAIKQYCNGDAIHRLGLQTASWMERVATDHPTAFNVVLVALGILLAYQVLTYEFTTNL